MVADNTKILTAEQEQQLRAPIDEYVGGIQKKIDALRADGTDKVLEYQGALEDLKRDRIYTAEEKAQQEKQAEEKARQMLAEDELTAQAKQKATENIKVAEDRSRELRRAANEYCEDALRRTEEAVSEAYDEIKRSRARFRAAAAGVQQPDAGGGAPAQGSRTVYDAAADE